MNCHKKIIIFRKNFSIPESTFQVIPLRLVIGSNDKGVRA